MCTDSDNWCHFMGKQAVSYWTKSKIVLESQINEQKERSDDIEEYKKYIQTKKFAEDIAKNKFGLIYPDEIVIKPDS